MKIIITPAGGTDFVLADDTVSTITVTTWANGAGGGIREGFLNKQKRGIQTSPLFRAAYALIIPRFNLTNRMTFTVQRSFSNAENCIKFIAYHPDSVPVQGEINLYNADSAGVVDRYLPIAVVESVECVKHVGSACEFTYTISGNGPWQTAE